MGLELASLKMTQCGQQAVLSTGWDIDRGPPKPFVPVRKYRIKSDLMTKWDDSFKYDA